MIGAGGATGAVGVTAEELMLAEEVPAELVAVTAKV
jgi:hypothetical protein